MIAVAEELKFLSKYLAEIRNKFQRKRRSGVNLRVAYNSRKTNKEQGMETNRIQKASTRKQNDALQS